MAGFEPWTYAIWATTTALMAYILISRKKYSGILAMTFMQSTLNVTLVKENSIGKINYKVVGTN